MVARDNTSLFTNQAVPVGTFQTARWNGGFIEADYNPIQIPRWLFIYRYDWITNTHQPDSGLALPDGRVQGNFNNTQQHTLGMRYNFHFSTRTDVALHLEYSNLQGRHTAASGGDQIQDTVLVGFDFAL
jgi:hypothetical protein